MPAKNAKNDSEGFSAEERAAMKERAAELRAEGKKGAKRADGSQAVLDRIAEMAPEDRVLAERVHVTVTATAPELSPKTWYGMPGPFLQRAPRDPTEIPRRGRGSSEPTLTKTTLTGTRPPPSRVTTGP